MAVPISRRTAWWLALIVTVIAVREWRIRRHEGGIHDWPRAGDRS